ncbi:MAG: hypothetical protein K9K86_11715 [Pseudomonadales bacterium]|nr:hypothetical protein [Pseudomonadales bacterium]
MESIREYYLNALLAQAAYGDLSGIALSSSEHVINSLQVDTNGDPNLTDTLANYVWDNYTILDHYANDAVGFSATVFKHKETHEITIAFRGTELESDTVNDVLIADIYGIVKNGSAEEQIVSAYNYYQQLITPAGQSILQLSLHVDTQLPPNTLPFATETIGGEATYSWIEQTTVVNSSDHAGKLVGENSASITTTGHSLGGHLATAFNRMFFGEVGETYTYNGPGFGGTRVDAFFGELPGVAANFNSSEIVNVSGTGYDLIAGYNNMYGEELDVFIEELSAPETYKEHSSSSLLDSLAVMELLHTLDSTLSLAQHQIMLESSSNVFVDSLEGIVDGLGKLFVGVGYIDTSIGDFTMQDRRESLHANIQTIKGRLTLDGNGYANLTLSIVSASSIADFSTQNTDLGRGYRYALVNLLPFAITSNLTGTAADDPQYDAANFSTAYLADRAQMLELLITRNTLDITTSDSLDENQEDALYIDQATNLKLTTGAISLVGVTDSTNRIYFGDESANVPVVGVESGMGDDRLYGIGGDDILHGGGGSGHIEGNLGNDELYGDEGRDYLFGGAGEDKLYGGKDNDVLYGGAYDNAKDTYYFELGDGNDYIAHADSGEDRIVIDVPGIGDLADLAFKKIGNGDDVNTYVANGGDASNNVYFIQGCGPLFHALMRCNEQTKNNCLSVRQAWR